MPRVREGGVRVSPRQAAWLTEQPQKTVDKSIERGELPPRGGDRLLDATDVLYLAVRKDVGETLTAQGKQALYAALAKESISFDTSDVKRTEVTVQLTRGVQVEVTDAFIRLLKRWRAMQRAERAVVEDPEIRSGEPVVRGTRIPVYMIADLVSQGAQPAELLEDYPALSPAKLEAAMTYAETNPRRGRPRSSWKEGNKQPARTRK